MTSPNFPVSPEMPISTEELSAAMQGTRQRGARIMGALMGLAALSVLLSVLLVAGMLWGFRTLPDWLKQLAQLDSTSGTSGPDLPDFAALPAWLPFVLAALILLGTALQVWATLVARRMIGAARDYTLGTRSLDPGSALHPPNEAALALAASARVVRPWITLGQYAPILSSALSVLLSAGGAWWASRLDPQADSVGPFGMGFVILSTLVQTLPGIIINWLILAAIRRLLDGLVARSQGQMLMLRPLGRKVDPWLLFTMILLILGLVSVIFSALTFLMFPAFIALILQGEAPDPTMSALMPFLKGLFGGLAGVLLLSSLVYLLLTFLLAWSRGFAMNVATVLDAALPGSMPTARSASGVSYASADPWAGEVRQATPRPPR